eukprot:TRINITY_DN62132_c0_g1_i1.p1 TRINITY_DN62132_c0_g1~~TRINITY_DN62132_c0_g1_i1.p1  ORF type:complete len:823 (+),score=140.14 TRINITY_DN62132_c0_g1_i1:62-2470(+)
MEHNLSDIAKLWGSKIPPSKDFQPCFQVLDINLFGKQAAAGSGEPRRFKAKLTDGEFHCEAVIVSPLSNEVDNGNLKVNSMIRAMGWSFMPMAKKKNGASTEVLFLPQGEVLGLVPEERRANLLQLRKFSDGSGSGLTQTQACPDSQPVFGQTSAPASSASFQFVTPEKRSLPAGAGTTADQSTPLPVHAPAAHLSGGAPAGQEQAKSPVPPAWGASADNPYSVGSGSVPGQPAAAGAGVAVQSMTAAPWRSAPPAQVAPQHTPQGGGLGFGGSNPYSGGGGGPSAQPQAPASADAAGRGTAVTDMFRGRGVSGGGAGGQASFGGGCRPPVAGNDSGCLPIRELTPYSQGRWKIKARVVAKEGIRHFTNARGEGQLFKIDLIDKDGGEVSATFFGRAVDKHFEVVRPGQIYYFSRGSVKTANKRFDRGDVVITFDEGSLVEPAGEDRGIPGVAYSFKPITEILASDVGTIVDVKGVVADAREVFTITVKSTQRERAKRELILWDESGGFVELTIWGDQAHENFAGGSVFYARGARVTEWNGNKALNFSGAFELNPDDQQAFALLRAYEAAGRPSQGSSGGGVAARQVSGAGRSTIQEIREEDLHLGPPALPGQPFAAGGPRSIHRHTLQAMVTPIAQDRAPFYLSCPELVERATQAQTQTSGSDRRACLKKMSQEGGCWRCSSGHTCARPVARYMCQRVEVLDHTGGMEISFFDDVGRIVFGCEADALAEIWEDPSREAERDALIGRAAWRRVILRLRSAKDMWNEEERIKVTAEGASCIDYGKDARQMLSQINGALAATAT